MYSSIPIVLVFNWPGVITVYVALHCSWFQPEMSRQMCEDVLKEEVDIQK